MGTIMAVVAVLLIHMDRKAVTNMKPKSSLGTDGDRRTRRLGLRGPFRDRVPRTLPAPGSPALVGGVPAS